MIELLTENIGLIAYALAGVIYVKLEDDCYEVDFSECSPLVKYAFIAQMIIHYFRIALVWPTYMIEDFLVYVTNRGEDFEEGDDDDGIV